MLPARLLDLTRLVSRLGRAPLTGVDRVELAYLEALLADPVPLFALVRTALGFVLLNSSGAVAIKSLVRGDTELGQADTFGRLSRRGNPMRARAETALRGVALARCSTLGLSRMLRRHLPIGCTYVNVGHANLSTSVMRAVRGTLAAKVAVLVHDTIPLDFPQYCRAETSVVFSRKLAAVAAHADLVIHTTQSTRAMTEAHFSQMGRIPDGLTVPLGVIVAPPGQLPAGVDPIHPYFVALGTIEPRKNHALLLDVWEMLGSDAPPLYIVGARGWVNDAVFARLDAGVRGVIELNNHDDPTVAAILQNATALLFPSFAEGFGLPPVEAAMMSVPVISSQLQQIRDVLSDYPIYLDSQDKYAWLAAIDCARLSSTRKNAEKFDDPDLTWEAHFNAVLTKV